MKLAKKNTKRVIFALVLVALIVSTYNASIVHLYYRIITTKADKEANTRRYHYLAYEELKLIRDDQISMREERRKLYYWFHARGWSIDEDEESKSKPWQELRIYWSN